MSSPSPAALWNRVDLAINQASTREQTVSELNRLLRKWFPAAPEAYISEEHSVLQQKWLTPQELDSQLRRGHARAAPRRVNGIPLLAVQYEGGIYMLDGTNRINGWLQSGDTELHEVIIIVRSAGASNGK